jgi:hypothetical protein
MRVLLCLMVLSGFLATVAGCSSDPPAQRREASVQVHGSNNA